MATQLRSPLCAAGRSARRRVPLPVGQRHARQVAYGAAANGQPKALETEADWNAFQAARSEQKSLIDHFTPFGSTQNRDNAWQPHHGLHRPKAPHETTLSALVAAGAHLGHSTSLLNPNFVPYAYGTRAGITLIDLDATLPLLRRAANVVRGIAGAGGSIVFVGSRPELRPIVKRAAGRLGSQGFHVGYRWLPGTLTNRFAFFTADENEAYELVPDCVVFLNPAANLAAIRECAMSHVPTIGIVDSNVDPRTVMYPIPANDESTRTAELVAGVLSVAGREGVELYAERKEQLIDGSRAALEQMRAEQARQRRAEQEEAEDGLTEEQRVRYRYSNP